MYAGRVTLRLCITLKTLGNGYKQKKARVICTRLGHCLHDMVIFLCFFPTGLSLNTGNSRLIEKKASVTKMITILNNAVNFDFKAT